MWSNICIIIYLLRFRMGPRVIAVLAYLVMVAAQCPKNCHCSKYRTACWNAYLQALPHEMRNTTEHLVMVGDNVTELTPQFFSRTQRNIMKTITFHDTMTETIDVAAFQNMSTLNSLTVTRNDIFILKAGTFRDTHRLSRLNLSYNKINILIPGAFSGLQNLKVLDLSVNILERLSHDTFDGMRHINGCRTAHDSFLDLSNNLIQYVEPGTFRGLCHYNDLDLSNNLIKNLTRTVFVGLKGLKRLNLHQNRINSLERDLFDDIEGLTELDLKETTLHTLHGDTFQKLSLRVLHMTYYPADEAEVVSFQGPETLLLLDFRNNCTILRHGMFQKLKGLKKLYLKFGNVRIIESGAFLGLHQLLYLDLHYNKIEILSDNIFKGLLTTTNLDLSFNKIKYVHKDAFIDLNKLRYLDLSMNQLNVVDNTAFSPLTRLDYLNFQNCSDLNLLSGMLRHLQVVKQLELSVPQGVNLSTGLSNVLRRVFSDTVAVQGLTISGLNKVLKIKDFQDLDLLTLELMYSNIPEITSNAFADLPNLRRLDIFHCELEIISVDAFKHLNALTELRLIWNIITSLEPGVFRALQRLEIMDLSWNDISSLHEGVFGAVCEEDVQNTCSYSNHISYNTTQKCNITYALKRLKQLYLAFNKIEYIHPHTFLNCEQLTVLDLSYNALLTLETDFLKVPSLVELNMTKCNITQIKETTFKCTPSISKLNLRANKIKYLHLDTLRVFEHLEILYLSDNPLICDCFFQETLNWLHSHHIQAKEYSKKDEMFRINTLFCNNSESWNGLVAGLDCQKSSKIPLLNTDEFQFFKMYVEPVIFGLILVIGIMGNTFLLLLLLSRTDLRKGINISILNLVVGDLLFLIFNLPLSYLDYSYPTWDFGVILCKVFMAARDFTVGVTVFSVVSLSIQRYIIVTKSFGKNKGICCVSEEKTPLVLMLMTCGLAFGIALPTFFSAKVDIKCLYSDHSGYIRRTWTIHLFVFCVLPVLLICFLNFKSVRYLQVSIRRMPGERQPAHQVHSRIRLANTVMVLTGVFFVSYFPNFLLRVLFVWSLLEAESRTTFLVSFWSFCMFFFNSCFNPVALFCMSTTFRNLLYETVTCGHVKSLDRPTSPVSLNGIALKQHNTQSRELKSAREHV
ncbi:slit homolog 2 protein-like [Periplaneta americana]|uniref:slit homolog 2 protein-like n=1 Tax=Periplaneta americana TaxID=6978 RepID=UPI0037E73E37